MAVSRRPYLVTHIDIQHMVEATSPAAAVQHVVGSAVTELRPARASELLAWTRANKPIEIAGEKTLTAAAETECDPLVWDVADTAAWIAEQDGDTRKALNVWRVILREGRMDIEQFDLMRVAMPVFAEALIGIPVAGPTAMTIESLRAILEQRPAPIEDVIERIGDHNRRQFEIVEAALPEVKEEP